MSRVVLKNTVHGDKTLTVTDIKLKNAATGNDFGVGYGNADNSNSAPIEILQTPSFYSVQGDDHFRYSALISNINTDGDASQIIPDQASTITIPTIINFTDVVDVADLSTGNNYITLGETDDVVIKLFAFKGEAVSPHPRYDFDYLDTDNTYKYNVVSIVEAGIALYNKPDNKEIAYYKLNAQGMLYKILLNKFVVSGALIDITNFDNKYLNSSVCEYNSVAGKYIIRDTAGISTAKIFTDDSFVDGPTEHFVCPIVTLTAYDYWVGSGTSYSFTREKIVASDGSNLTIEQMLEFAESGTLGFILNRLQPNNDPNTFLNLLTIYRASYEDNTLYGVYLSDINSDYNYKRLTPGNNYITTLLTYMGRTTPIMIGLMNRSNREGFTSLLTPVDSDNVAYVPLATTVTTDPGGDGPTPDPIRRKTINDLHDLYDEGTETITDSVDGNTNWSGQQTDGYESYNYPVTQNVGGMPGATNAYRPSYSNFIFKRVRATSTSWNQDIMMFMFSECTFACGAKLAANLYRLATGKPTISEVINRMYMLPFEYDEIVDVSAGIDICAPVYGPLGIVTAEYGQHGSSDSVEKTNEHYYKRLVNKFKQFNLGTITVSRVFNNYLDYQTKYNLSLPYMAGTVEIDPNFLFNNKAASGTISLVGWLDFDTAVLVIKVIVNNNLYFETSTNVGIDMSMAAFNTASVTASIAKLLIGSAVAAGAGVTRSTLRSAAMDNKNKQAEIERERQINEWNRKEEVRQKNKLEIIEKNMENTSRRIEAQTKAYKQQVELSKGLIDYKTDKYQKGMLK